MLGRQRQSAALPPAHRFANLPSQFRGWGVSADVEHCGGWDQWQLVAVLRYEGRRAAVDEVHGGDDGAEGQVECCVSGVAVDGVGE